MTHMNMFYDEYVQATEVCAIKEVNHVYDDTFEIRINDLTYAVECSNDLREEDFIVYNPSSRLAMYLDKYTFGIMFSEIG